MESKKYNNIKLGFSISKTFITFLLILGFLLFGFSEKLVEYLSQFSENSYIVLLLFILIIGLATTVIFFPANLYTDFILEHKYNLSNQTFFAWVWENIKSSLVGGVIGLPILLLFYYILTEFDQLWWLPFSILMFIISVVLSKIVPIIILPLFYKVSPIEDEDLKNRILELSKNVNMNIENIFQFDMSKNTKKANAAFTGLGKTKKILLGDTLLNEFTNDEIETVIAHELGHYKHKHIVINLVISTLTSFLTFYLLSVLYSGSLSWFSFSRITEVGALPILSLWGMIIGLVQSPLTNILSRRHEYQADEYAVRETNKKDIFIGTLSKLTDQNLGDKDPHPFVEWFFYSHPSIKNRIANINKINLA